MTGPLLFRNAQPLHDDPRIEKVERGGGNHGGHNKVQKGYDQCGSNGKVQGEIPQCRRVQQAVQNRKPQARCHPAV